MFRYIVLGEFKYVSENYEIHDGHFLNGFIFHENTLAQTNYEGLFHLHDKIVCIIDIDPLNDYQPRELPSFIPSPYVSTDGIPILTPKVTFCFKLMNKIGSIQNFENKLVFGSKHFSQEMKFEFIQKENNIYIHSLGKNGSQCLYSTDDERIELSDEATPENNIRLVPGGEYSGLFIMSDGEYYYEVNFDNNEVECAVHMENASLFQLISL